MQKRQAIYVVLSANGAFGTNLTFRKAICGWTLDHGLFTKAFLRSCLCLVNTIYCELLDLQIINYVWLIGIK